MNLYIKSVVATAILLVVPLAHSYKIQTHDELSKRSALCSVLRNDSFMESIGWSSITSIEEQYQFIKEKKKLDVLQTIGWGAIYEDDTETKKRPLNHFFDPLRNKGGNILGIEYGETSNHLLSTVNEETGGLGADVIIDSTGNKHARGLFC